MDLAIDAQGVVKQYGGDAGLRHLDLTVDVGSVVGLIGPSGAGKTTAVRLFTGLLTREDGELRVLDADPEDFDPELRRRIGYLPQDTLLYPTLSVHENLDFVAATYGLWGRPRREARQNALDFVELADVGDRRLEALSGGMKRRAGLAASLLHSPDLLLLDEPTAGQDPILRRTIWQNLRRLSESGTTIVVTTQHVDEAGYCDAVVLLSEGEVVAEGTPDQLEQTAFGGELVDVTFESSPSWPTINAIGEAIGAVATETTGSRSVRYTVVDAAAAIPAVVEAATTEEIGVTETARHHPAFDETFVRLVDGASVS